VAAAGAVLPLSGPAASAAADVVPGRMQHRHVLDRHRLARLQTAQAGRRHQVGDEPPREARQRHHLDARFQAAHCQGDAGIDPPAEGRRLQGRAHGAERRHDHGTQIRRDAWNEKSNWIKLSDWRANKKEPFVDFILGDNVPVQALWYFGWGVARQFVVALNMGTMGFWWWHMPQHVDRWFERLRDLETGQELKLARKPSIVIDWGQNRVFTLEDLGRTAAIFGSLTPRGPDGRQGSLDYYVGGLTFLALNDVHWQCEAQSFGNFFESLRHMMAKHGDWTEGQPFVPSFLKFIDELFPNLDEKERYAALIKAFDENKLDGVAVATPDFTRDLLVSLHPRHASNILSGKKTVQLRRRFPQQHTRGALALIYSTAPVQAVVGVARMKHVLKLPVSRIWKEYGAAACVSKAEVKAYFSGLREGYVILLEEVRPFKRQLKMEDLYSRFGIVPPQSYRYVTGGCVELLNNERVQAPDQHERGHWARRRPTRSSIAG
jgi:predicted transcriptional regulator